MSGLRHNTQKISCISNLLCSLQVIAQKIHAARGITRNYTSPFTSLDFHSDREAAMFLGWGLGAQTMKLGSTLSLTHYNTKMVPS